MLLYWNFRKCKQKVKKCNFSKKNVTLLKLNPDLFSLAVSWNPEMEGYFFYSLLAFTHSLVTFVFSVLIIVDKSILKK